MGKIQQQTFNKEDVHTGGNEHVKRFSILLPMRKMQIKTTMRYHLTCIRMAKIKNGDNIKCQ